MRDGITELITTLSETPGPVGREDLVQDRMTDHFQRHGLEVERDKIGNIRATIKGTNHHYAIVAHADEVGFLVSNVNDEGFIQAKWNTQSHMPDLRLLPGQRVTIMKDGGFVPGCFCVKTAHIAGKEGKKSLPEWDDVFIDIGMASAEEVHDAGIAIGDPVLYAAGVEKIGNNLVGKAMDDRVGLAIMIGLLGRLQKTSHKNHPTITFISTVMEELGAKGAASVANHLDVDGVIIIDVGLADDYPGTEGESGVSLGGGPSLVIKDNQIHYSHSLNSRILEAAEKEGLPVQRAVFHNYATDGFQIASQGEVVAALGVPCRYTHSSFETVNPTDIETTIQLIHAFLNAQQ
ncbi:MAG: M20/M25/M40 family metallo-hydrolase [Candidatus Thorarchaeota archaeon]|nr:M20/M25/M40 family metallo-hydrolase [Candidatus Thorarchaeota archaeon]